MRWSVHGDVELYRREAARLEAQCGRGERLLAELAELDPPAFLKASPLTGRAAWRHAARALLWAKLPRLAEFENLDWLRRNGFDAPRPLLAGAAWSGGLPRYQFLYTEAVRGVRGLEQVLAEQGELARAAVLALARTAARLHARGFVHRDLFARNVLVGADEREPRIVLLDAWRGGARPGLRGPAYDVGCLQHDLERLGAPELIEPATRAYAAECERLGQPLDAGFKSAVARARAARARRDARARAKRARRGHA
jgi:tRNA A-37 threonylcarbamoyl transferase component Bud32